jgi:broad specificity phosphatase PhoE
MTQRYPYRIIFLRHGRTAYNAENRLQGQRDIPLDGKGREQAGAIGRFLRDHFGAEIMRLEASGAFWCSPLLRTRQTMAQARLAMGLPPQPYGLDARLKELAFGDWEGLTWEEVEAKYPGAQKFRDAGKWDFTPPGGESYAALAERLKSWLAERNGDVFVVSHGGVARALIALLADVAPSAAANAEIAQGRALIFDKSACSWVG